MMEQKSLGFAGGGRITRIFLQAFRNKKFEPGKIVVYDTNKEVLDTLKTGFPDIVIAGSPEAVFRQEIVFIAVHPPVIMDMLDKMKQLITDETVVVSLAPKISMAKIKAQLNTGNIVRMIPNATSYINEGYNPVCFATDFRHGKNQLLDMFGVLGKTFEVPEEKLEAYAMISAMLPTYFWFQWKILADLGVKMGMDEDEANETIYETLIASLNILFKSGENADKVMDLIPVKPIGEHEGEIEKIYDVKLWSLFEKIRP